jgi:hypothetical protein
MNTTLIGNQVEKLPLGFTATGIAPNRSERRSAGTPRKHNNRRSNKCRSHQKFKNGKMKTFSKHYPSPPRASFYKMKRKPEAEGSISYADK